MNGLASQCLMSAQHVFRPVVIVLIRDNELDFIVWFEVIQIVPKDGIRHPAAGTFEVDNQDGPPIHGLNRDSPACFDQNVIALIQQGSNKVKALCLEQRLPACDFDQ